MPAAKAVSNCPICNNAIIFEGTGGGYCPSCHGRYVMPGDVQSSDASISRRYPVDGGYNIHVTAPPIKITELKTLGAISELITSTRTPTIDGGYVDHDIHEPAPNLGTALGTFLPDDDAQEITFDIAPDPSTPLDDLVAAADEIAYQYQPLRFYGWPALAVIEEQWLEKLNTALEAWRAQA